MWVMGGQMRWALREEMCGEGHGCWSLRCGGRCGGCVWCGAWLSAPLAPVWLIVWGMTSQTSNGGQKVESLLVP